MSYFVHLLPSAERDCNHLHQVIYRRCRRVLHQLENDPRPHGCQKLTGEEGYRVRVGDYRILYRIDNATRRVYVYRVKHRREVYR